MDSTKKKNISNKLKKVRITYMILYGVCTIRYVVYIYIYIYIYATHKTV